MSDTTGMRQVFMGLVVTAMGAAIANHAWMGFAQIVLGAALTCLGVWKITRKKLVTREDGSEGGAERGKR